MHDDIVNRSIRKNQLWKLERYHPVLTLFDMGEHDAKKIFLSTVLKRFGVESWNFVT